MSGHKRSTEVHPLTWLGAALLLPLACWDVRQAEHDVQLRREAFIQRLVRHPAVTRRSGEIARISPVVASREMQRAEAITPEP